MATIQIIVYKYAREQNTQEEKSTTQDLSTDALYVNAFTYYAVHNVVVLQKS